MAEAVAPAVEAVSAAVQASAEIGPAVETATTVAAEAGPGAESLAAAFGAPPGELTNPDTVFGQQIEDSLKPDDKIEEVFGEVADYTFQEYPSATNGETSDNPEAGKSENPGIEFSLSEEYGQLLPKDKGITSTPVARTVGNPLDANAKPTESSIDSTTTSSSEAPSLEGFTPAQIALYDQMQAAYKANSPTKSDKLTSNTPDANQKSSQKEDVGGDFRFREMGMSLQDQNRIFARFSSEELANQHILDAIRTKASNGGFTSKADADAFVESVRSSLKPTAIENSNSVRDNGPTSQEASPSLREATPEDIRRNQEDLDKMQSQPGDAQIVDGQVREAPSNNPSHTENLQAQNETIINQKSQEQVNNEAKEKQQLTAEQQQIQILTERVNQSHEQLNQLKVQNEQLVAQNKELTARVDGLANAVSELAKVMKEMVTKGAEADSKEKESWLKILAMVLAVMLIGGTQAVGGAK